MNYLRFPTRIALALAAFSLASGCVSREAGVADLGATVSERFGTSVRWQTAARDDGDAPDEVAALVHQPITPSIAARIALLNNRDLRASMAQLGVAAASLSLATQLPNPNVDVSYQFPLGSGNQSRPALIDFNASIDVRALILLPARQGAANAEMRAVRFDLAGRALDLAYRAESELYAYIAAQQAVEMRRTVLQAVGASFEAARLLTAAGNTTELDRAQQEVEYQDARLALVAAENTERQQRERVNEVLGLWGPSAAWQTEARLPSLPDADPDIDDVERRALERSLRLSAIRERLGADQGRVQLANASGWLPSLEAGVAAAQHEGVVYAGPSVRVGIPLLNHAQGDIGLREAELRRDQAEFVAEGVHVRAAVRAAHAQLLFARERARFYRDVQLPLRARVVEQAQLQFNAMQLGVFQLLQARRAQIEAGGDYIEALRDYWIARAALARILSGGSASMAVGEQGISGNMNTEESGR